MSDRRSGTISPTGGDSPPEPESIDQPEQTNLTWIVYTNKDGDRKRITVAEYLRKGL